MAKLSNIQIDLPPNKKAYFASDFHLGVPDKSASLEREKKIVRWLDACKKDAAVIFLVGDLFDFWFEYKNTIPKGFSRFIGKLAEISDSGIQLVFFTGNHDMWMYDYFSQEINARIFYNPIQLKINKTKVFMGHGDGLGPGDRSYKFLKKVFRNKIFQWLFQWFHPNIGISIANFWSRKSRAGASAEEEKFLGDDEWLWTYAKEKEAGEHHDVYIFGHRHLPIDVPVGDNSRYLNLGEWINYCTYAMFDGVNFELKTFEG